MIKVLDFWADWCHPCKIMAPVISELEVELKDKVIFEKIDVDENPKLAQKYNIFSIPTYVVVKNGQELERIIGVTSKESFLSFLKKHLLS